MLLEQVVAELSETNRNWRPSSEGGVPEAKETGDISRTVSRELELHLETEREFFKRLLARKAFYSGDSQSESSSSGCLRPGISVPFQWEERPGKPKSTEIQEQSLVLSTPPVRKGNYVDSQFLADAPKPLSSKLRSMLQIQAKLQQNPWTENENDEKFVLGVVNYPEEFQWRSLRAASPMTIYEGPESSPANNCSNLLSYCSNRPLSSASMPRDCVPVLLANRLASVNDLLNAVPVERCNSGTLSQGLLLPPPRERGNRALKDNDSVSISSKSSSRNNSCGQHELSLCNQGLLTWKEEEQEEQSEEKDFLAIVPARIADAPATTELPTSVSDDLQLASSVSLSKKKSRCAISMKAQDSKTVGSGNEFCFERSLTDQGAKKPWDSIKKKTFKDPLAEDNGLRKLIENPEGGNSQKHTQPNRWPNFKRRMKIVGCCPCSKNNDIACCSSSTATPILTQKAFKERKIPVSRSHKIQVEWTKLQEKEELQK
eukprot:TRINITY_DN6245_c0_g1_i1.p1 TRINITY_DN6245_c0_g1~~TRINITY_DN6245_c0_g1_i1.p1  ORF type:complete len:487 (-),score=97.25 TRINITY_DN6245_c0_g1_i1:502-1962(-)